jgi:hypothetical protein
VGASLNGASTEEQLGQVITFRNLAARLKEIFRDRRLEEEAALSVGLTVWFQQFLGTEPADFWRHCWRHLEESVQAETLRLWMGYPEQWEIPPALRGPGIDAARVLFAGDWALYPVRAAPRGETRLDGSLPDGTRAAEARICRHGTYVRGAVGEPPLHLEPWHRVYRRPRPSRTAILRCIRMCVLSRLVGRRLASSKELLVAEAQAFHKWALVAAGQPGEPATTSVAAEAAAVMRALILDDSFVVLVHQLPRRSGA